MPRKKPSGLVLATNCNQSLEDRKFVGEHAARHHPHQGCHNRSSTSNYGEKGQRVHGCNPVCATIRKNFLFDCRSGSGAVL